MHLRTLFSLTFLLAGLLLGCGSEASSEAEEQTGGGADTAARSETYFETTGDVAVTVDPATANLSQNRAGIWALNVTSAPASVRELGRSYAANLFFSEDFQAAPGTYPVQFSYRNETNTLGGSFVGPGLFSHDTTGEAEFLEFGEQVKVRFEFTTYNKSEGSDGRQRVTVKGEAVCPRGEFP